MRGSSTPPPEAALQDGVFTVAQALSAGYTHYRVRNLVRTGRWIAVLGSVYADRSSHLNHASLARAAVLAAGTNGVASHTTAARLWDLDVPPDPDVHVIIDPRRRLTVPGLRVHRIRVSEAEMCSRKGILTTRLDRTVADCLLWLPEEAGTALATSVLQRQVLTVGEMRRALHLAGQRHGSPRAWAILASVGLDARSNAEVRFHELLRRGGVGGWRANVDVRDGDGFIGCVDVLFDEVSLVIEVDGRAYHSGDEAFQRDRERQNRLVRNGYTVLRFTWDDIVRRPDRVLAEVRQMLRALRAAS